MVKSSWNIWRSYMNWNVFLEQKVQQGLCMSWTYRYAKIFYWSAELCHAARYLPTPPGLNVWSPLCFRDFILWAKVIYFLHSVAAVDGRRSLYSQVLDLHAQSLCPSETIEAQLKLKSWIAILWEGHLHCSSEMLWVSLNSGSLRGKVTTFECVKRR